MKGPIETFFSYAHDDEPLMDDVRRQLIVYERNGRIPRVPNIRLSLSPERSVTGPRVDTNTIR